MLKRVMLCNKINEFYKMFGGELYNAPAHTTLRDVNDNNFLTDVLYDISEILPCAPNKSARVWLKKLERDIRNYGECKSTVLSTIITAVMTIIILWLCVSTIEVMVKNGNEHPEYSRWNAWEIVTSSNEGGVR